MSEGKGVLPLLLNPLSLLLSEAKLKVRKSTWQGTEDYFHVGVRLVPSLMLARDLAKQGTERREDMPVIHEDDLESLKDRLRLSGFDEVYTDCEITPTSVLPTQCEIWVDKVVDAITQHGVEGSIQFLKANALVVDRDNRLIDGHHRWLCALMLDRRMELPAFRINYPLSQLLTPILAYTDPLNGRNA